MALTDHPQLLESLKNIKALKSKYFKALQKGLKSGKEKSTSTSALASRTYSFCYTSCMKRD